MMIVSRQDSREETLVDNICNDLEVIFVSLSKFEDQVRITRREFISKIGDCLEKYSIAEIPVESLLYKKLYLLYIKCVRSHVHFKLERNRARFLSILDMEAQFNDIKLEKTALTRLCLSKKSESIVSIIV